MAVKVVRRPVLTFWEKTYIPQIICGLKITTRHFFRNLFLHTAHLLGRLKHLPASVTVQYPEELRPLMSRYRSRHRLTVREDNTPRCVGCMLCETVCPARCITIVPGEHPDPNVEKYPIRFDIDLGVCVYCGYCVEVCPEDAIRMDTGILDLSAYSREAMRLDIHELMDPDLRKPISECCLKFPHKCEVTGEEMKGSWDDVKSQDSGKPKGWLKTTEEKQCPFCQSPFYQVGGLKQRVVSENAERVVRKISCWSCKKEFLFVRNAPSPF